MQIRSDTGMTKRNKVLFGGVLGLAVVLGGAGTAYAAHFQDRALPGSTLAGEAVAGMSRDEVAAAVRERAAAVEVTLEAGEGTRTATLAELGYAVDVDATVDAVFANRSWSTYATSLMSSRDVDAVVTTDPAATDAVIADLVKESGGIAVDAQVKLAKDKKSFVVVPAVSGKTVVESTFQNAVAAAARDLTPATTAVEFVEAVPDVTTEEAKGVADEANALVAVPVELSDGEDTHKASAARKASWVAITATDGGLGTPTIQAAKIQAWATKLAKEAKVETREGLRNVSQSGDVKSVVKKARDGKEVSNADAVAKAAAAALASGKGYEGAFEYKTVKATWKERTIADGAENLAYPAAPGEKWIDVNLDRHTMTAYVGAKKVYGPIKMVDGQDEKPTVRGTFKVYYKRELMTMRGNNADGTRYETPDVPWSTFFHEGFALHGAPWRSSFGYSASHGCINLPVGVAKWVYDFAPIGTPVVSH
jgi:lipoprotein-anchoring transpeptidase ErfK/SrfK